MSGDPWEEPFMIREDVAHPARIYDWLLNGDVNFEVDRIAGAEIAAAYPGGLEAAQRDIRANRAFLVRAVRYLACEAGVRQFLDIGTGIPNADNVHGAAREAAPDSRVVYVDNDPIVLAHGHQLLAGTPDGTVSFLHEDLRHPARILERAAETLDFTQPVAVLLVGILHYLDDEDDPYGVVEHLLEGMSSGSYLLVSHLASDVHPEEMAEMQSRASQTRDGGTNRSHADVARFFAGLEVLDPGVVPVDVWRPDEAAPTGHVVPIYGGMGQLERP